MKKIKVKGVLFSLNQVDENTLHFVFDDGDPVIVFKRFIDSSIYLRDPNEGSPMMIDILKKKIWMFGYVGVNYEEIEE